jgi:hypothetical protein
MRPLVRTTSVACGSELEPLVRCRPGESAGTTVEVLPESACHGDYYRDEETEDRLALPDSAAMFAVTAVPDSLKDSFPGATYVLIVSGSEQWGRSFALSEDDIVGVSRGCSSAHPFDFVLTTAAKPSVEFLLGPQNTH